MENHFYHSARPRIWWGLRIAGWVILGIAGAVFFAFLFGYFVMLLWNWLMPAIFGLTVITFWQAFGIIILARLIVGSFGHKHNHDSHTSPREHFFRRSQRKKNHDWKKWKHYDSFWKEEGEEAFSKYVEMKEGSGKDDREEN